MSDLRWIFSSYFRDCAEKFYYEILRKVIYFPFTIYSISLLYCNTSLFPSQQLSRSLDFRSYNSNQSCVSRIFYLSLEQNRIFCWKNCTVYGLEPALIEIDSFDIFDREYRVWFPRRASNRDISNRSFWKIYLLFQLSEDGTASKIWKFYQIFCEQLKILAREIKTSTIKNWKIRDSFEEIVMLIHKSWKNNRIRLV